LLAHYSSLPRHLLVTGIFAYLNYGVQRTRTEVINFLIQGLKRLEYRGYDSAGLAIDGNAGNVVVVKAVGPVVALAESAAKKLQELV